jgi:hypothetical protein
MSGELRRPPQLWEQRLSRTTSILGVGISSSGDATSIVPPQPPPGAGGGTEPAPVAPPPGVFKKPSTPQLIGAVQGINVLWDGLNADGDLWPYDTSYIEVHMDTSGTAFTPGTATLKGRLARPGGLYVGGLSAGTTYYFRFRGADPAGNFTDPSDAASGLTGLTTASDYGTATIGSGAVSFDARAIGGITTTVGTSQPSSPNVGDIWLDTSGGNTTHKRWDGSSWVTQAWSTSSIGANVITATQIAAGAVTAGAIAAGAITAEKIQAGAVTTDKLTAGTITGFYISGGTISGGLVTGGTVTGASITTSAFNPRVALNDGGGRAAYLDIFSSNNAQHSIYGDLGDLIISPSSRLKVGKSVQIEGNLTFVGGGNGSITAGTIVAETMRPTADLIVFQGYRQSTLGTATNQPASDVIMRLNADVDVQNQAKFEVRADGDVLSRTNSFSGFSDARYKDNIAPARDYLDDLRDVEVVTFNWQGSEQKLLGVTAQQIQTIFPSMVAKDEDGTLSVRYSVFVPMLVTAVQSLADQVDDLRSRIEALEA